MLDISGFRYAAWRWRHIRVPADAATRSAIAAAFAPLLAPLTLLMLLCC